MQIGKAEEGQRGVQQSTQHERPDELGALATGPERRADLRW